MAEVSQNYKKIQAILCILVFGCIVGAFLVKSALLATGAILLACAICLMAAKIQPETPPDEHHHH